MSIIIEPQGGLGNQLFIYAVGLALARVRNTELICDTWKYHNYAWHDYELDSFSNSISKTYSSRSREIVGHKVRRLDRALKPLSTRLGLQRHLVLEETSAFDPRVLMSPERVRLSGYFQSWRYFDCVADDIRKEVTQPDSVTDWTGSSLSKFASLGNWTAVHVRRGTYLEVPNMGLAGLDYYRRAITTLDRLVGPSHLVFFSDSPELLSELTVQFSDRYTLCVAPPAVRPVEVLNVMSCASNFIIGNSTFSWWAAFLRENQDQVTIAPRPWLDDRSFIERDLLPLNWITVGREYVQ